MASADVRLVRVNVTLGSVHICIASEYLKAVRVDVFGPTGRCPEPADWLGSPSVNRDPPFVDSRTNGCGDLAVLRRMSNLTAAAREV